MKIKYHLSYRLREYGRKTRRWQIRLRVTFNSNRIDLVTGLNLDSKDFWNQEMELVRDGYSGANNQTAAFINIRLCIIKEQFVTVFKYFESNDIMPSTQQLLQRYRARIEALSYWSEMFEKDGRRDVSRDFFDVFDHFIEEVGEKNSWSGATTAKFKVLKNDLMNFNPKMSFKNLDENALTDFVRFLRDEKQLRTRAKTGDTIGLSNSSIAKKIGLLRWFLNWTLEKGYHENNDFKTFKPSLKQTQAKVIYLSKLELEQVMKMKIPAENSNLEYVRDIFLFSCFSGLRHSDVLNLKRSDIGESSMDITTIKTADSITVELNEITRMILNRYEKFQFPENRALPPLTNQTMNRNLKVLCRMAGIDSKVRITTYRGNVRRDIIKKKWELIGTHTGRRTFIVMALSMGIPPVVVMKWTGHADFKSMKPYVDIVDSIKSQSMRKFDDLMKGNKNGVILGQQYKENMNASDIADAIAVLTRFERAHNTGIL